MKKTMKKATVITLAAALAAGMLAGCGKEDKLDGTKTVATVDGAEIPLGILSLYARQTQAQTDALYQAYLGSSDGIWSQVVDEESGQTLGEQTVQNSLEQLEMLYLLKAKAADYEDVEITEEEQAAIAEAASAFMAANDEETLEELAVTEEQVKTLLELQTYQEKMSHEISENADVTVTDEEAQQSSFTYVNVSTSGDDLTDEQKEEKKTQAQEILDQMKEDPAADMDEIAKGVDESLSSVTGNFFTNKSEDEELTDYYADEVLDALRTLNDGEVYDEVVETESGYYVLRLDLKNDEDASATKKASILSDRQSDFYTETTEKWLEDAEITVDDKVLATLTITDDHKFTVKSVETTDETSEDNAIVEDEMEPVEEPTEGDDEELTEVTEEELGADETADTADSEEEVTETSETEETTEEEAKN